LKRPPELFERQKAKLDCSCGGKHAISGKAIHFKTKKHQDYINSLQED